jgi:hypothetical protein
MDRATETAIKAIILGLHRSKALSSHQLETVLAELTFAARDLAARDAETAAEVDALGIWLREATTKKDDGKKGRLSRF